ncbi:MAG TPA: ABC transporter permease [Sediminibacterium sp.]|nr:ABC transporter permease [Sediminibacterium sp.]
MFFHYFKIAVRNCWKNKGYTLINILGLSTGLAAFLAITLYVMDELSFDRFNEKADRIYRINSDIRFGGSTLNLAVCSDPMGPTLKKDYPEVEEYVRFYDNTPGFVKKDHQLIREQHIIYADSTLFDVFTLPAVEGDTRHALDAPNSVVISSTAARKYFGTTHAVGRSLEMDDKILYKVTAVIRDIPANSHFHFDFILPMRNVQDYHFGNFLSHNFQTYLLLKKGTDYHAFEKKFPGIIDKYVLPQARQFMQIKSMAEFEKAGNRLSYSLIPLTDIHLYSDRSSELGVNGNIQYVTIFSIVALFVLLLACINFMNLSTARSSNRAKEVGIRKVLGSNKASLVRQFLAESLIISGVAMVMAVCLVDLSLPYFDAIAAKTFSLSSLFTRRYLLVLIFLPLIVGFLAGIYPAFFLSAFQPIKVLKGSMNAGFKRSSLRNVLVVFQFATSIILIIGTMIVHNQLNYIHNTRLGFNKNQVLIVRSTYLLQKNVDAFRNEVLQIPGVQSGTLTGFLPVPSYRNDNSYSKEAVLSAESGLDMQSWRVDYDYIPTMGMEISEGRNFSKAFGSDSSGVILNETAVRLLGYHDPVGRILYGSDDHNKTIPLTIIGVVKNFHFASLRERIGPLCLRLGNNVGMGSFRIKSDNIAQIVQQVEAKWRALAGGAPFDYQFMDDAFDHMYHAEQRVGRIAMIFSILAILIACLGLFGLVAYAAEQRTREIGIRKVLGASVVSIISLLSRELLLLVLVAALIAFPIAWYAMNRWLDDFAYRIRISIWVFASAGFAAICIALLTVGFQAMKAALANPIKALRTE